MTIPDSHRVGLVQIARAAELRLQSERLQIAFEMARSRYLQSREDCRIGVQGHQDRLRVIG